MFKNIYKLICKFYSLISSVLENFFLKIKEDCEISETNLSKYGYQKIKLENKIIDKIIEELEIKNNKYITRVIIEKNNLNRIIERIFVDFKLSEQLTKITKFKYSIDYITLYKNISISHQDKHKEWYANHWHKDQPFSENSLKIIFSIKKLDKVSHGGIQILDKANSKLFHSLSSEQKDTLSYKMIADDCELIIFNPNLCFHKAGLIEGGYVREQIMIQLNPANCWQLNSNIYKKQYKIEPKFPFFSYFFDKKIRLIK